MSNTELVDFIAAIPDLTHHRFIDTDGEFSTKIHEPREVAERTVAALTGAGYEVVRVPDGQRLSLRADRDEQIALLNAAECKGFQWVGQTWDSCAGCGAPYWYHTHIERTARAAGPFDDAAPEYEPISEKSKQRMKRFYSDPANKGKMPSPLKTDSELT